MNHFRALAIKFVSTLALLYIILGLFYGMSFGEVFWISLILGTIAYIIGDLFILPRTSNMTATIADFGLSLFVIWFLSATFTMDDNLFTRALIASLGVALFEYVFHNYISRNVVNDSQTSRNQAGNLQYQTEASEELTPEKTDLQDETKQ